MTEHPSLRAARALCAVLEAENGALRAMDIGRANGLLADKQAAIDQLLATRRLISSAPALRWAEAGQLLAALADDNKRLLERAMVAQNRVMACIARAIARAMPAASGYGAPGCMPRPRNLPPVALSSSA
jgi:hypothetical protein